MRVSSSCYRIKNNRKLERCAPQLFTEIKLPKVYKKYIKLLIECM